MSNTRTDESINADHLRRRISNAAARLRVIADRIERIGESVGKSSAYTAVAAEVQGEIIFGLANMQLGDLVVSAGDADVARAKGK